MARLPGGSFAGEPDENALDGERESGRTVGEGAVVDISAGGEVTGEGRGLLPHLTAAAGELVIAVGEGLAMDDPEALRQEQEQQ